MKKEMICILCPRGCRISVDTENYEVTGNACFRGAQFGPQELLNPERLITTTIKIKGGLYPRLPVRTKNAIPKSKIKECMEIINSISIEAPVKWKEVIIKNIANTGVNVIASRSL